MIAKKKQTYTDAQKARNKVRQRAYMSRPEVAERYRLYYLKRNASPSRKLYDKLRSRKRRMNKEYVDKMKAYKKEYKKRPENIIRGRLLTQKLRKNKKWLKEFRRKQRDKKRKNPHLRIRSSLSSRVTSAIIRKNHRKSSGTSQLIGCSIEFLKIYLESLFRPGMSWANYGMKGWHIDHIKPCALFNMADPQQQRECFNYKNLQPLWCIENIMKADRVMPIEALVEETNGRISYCGQPDLK